MEHESHAGISFFQRYLTLWVLLCMVVGVASVMPFRLCQPF